jgi:hypothetical protein
MSEKMTAHDAIEIGVQIAERHRQACLEMQQAFPLLTTDKVLHGHVVWLATQIMCVLDTETIRK